MQTAWVPLWIWWCDHNKTTHSETTCIFHVISNVSLKMCTCFYSVFYFWLSLCYESLLDTCNPFTHHSILQCVHVACGTKIRIMYVLKEGPSWFPITLSMLYNVINAIVKLHEWHRYTTGSVRSEFLLHTCTNHMHRLRHWGRDKMAAFFQMTSSSAFSWMQIYEFWLGFHWTLFLRVQLTKFEHWFRYCIGAGQATSYCLNQWWFVYLRIYASVGLNELTALLLRYVDAQFVKPWSLHITYSYTKIYVETICQVLNELNQI